MQTTYRYESGAIADKVYGKSATGRTVVVYGWDIRSPGAQTINFLSGAGGLELWRSPVAANGSHNAAVVYEKDGTPIPKLKCRPGENLVLTSASAASIGIIWGVV